MRDFLKSLLEKMSLSELSQKIFNKTRNRNPEVERTIRRLTGFNNKKPIYIIRRVRTAGFFSNFFYVLGHIIYADQNNWDMVVDMENYPTPYNESEVLNGTKNAWEYYFEQPCGISLKEGYSAKHQVLSSGNYLYQYVPFYEIKEEIKPQYPHRGRWRGYHISFANIYILNMNLPKKPSKSEEHGPGRFSGFTFAALI